MTALTQTHPTLIGTLWPAKTNVAMRWIALMVLGTAFIAICAHFAVPLYPNPVPITMQTFAVLLIGMAYGARLGAATLALYFVEGLSGLPVFASAGALGPTLGYLIGFIVAAGVVGFLAERGWDRNVATTAAAMLIGNLAIYIPGLLVLAGFIGTGKVLEYGLFPFLLGDGLKLVLAAILLPVAWRFAGRPKN
jgi:biotin transport system substrate-specific component